MEIKWLKGPIPEDGKTYVTATQWLTKNEKSHYELIVATVDEEGRFCDGQGDEIYSHDAEDVDWYLPIPPIPKE
jgi:hypothetical protein